MILSKLNTLFLTCLLGAFVISCSVDNTMLSDSEVAIEEEQDQQEMEDESVSENQACNDIGNFVFNEQDGFLRVEFENAVFTEDWKLKNDDNLASGDGYMVWEGAQSLSNPGNGKTTFNIKINNAGTYQFLWYSSVKTGDNGTDHNDTWLRFNNADDFYAENGDSVVYPLGSGKTPNPEGASKEGWFKIYRSGNNLDFKWQASTFDNSAHKVYVTFENPGTYLMEISARSSGHAIDKFILFNDSFTQSDAISEENSNSEITCD